MPVHGGSSIAFTASLHMLQQDTFLSFVILGSCKFGISTILLGCFGSVHSSACSAQLFQNHRIQFWDHFLKSWSALKQFVFQERREPPICTTASEGRSHGDVESEAVQLNLLRQQMHSEKMVRSLKILKTCKVSSRRAI